MPGPRKNHGRTGPKLHERYRIAAYQKAVGLLLEARDLLENVKTVNWTQAVVLNDVYLRLREASEALIEVSPSDLSNAAKRRVNREY